MHKSPLLLFIGLFFVQVAAAQMPGAIEADKKPNKNYIPKGKSIELKDSCFAGAYRPITLSFQYYTGAPFKWRPVGTTFHNTAEDIFTSDDPAARYCSHMSLYLDAAYMPGLMQGVTPWLNAKKSDTISYIYQGELIANPRILIETVDEYLRNFHNPPNWRTGIPAYQYHEANRSPNGLDNPIYFKTDYVTNAEYREFINYTRDSLLLRYIGDEVNEDIFIIDDEYELEIDPPLLDWDKDIEKILRADGGAITSDFYYADRERFYNKKEIDSRRLVYEYYWVNWEGVAKTPRGVSRLDREKAKEARNRCIIKEIVNVYPDTLAWLPNSKDYYAGCFSEAVMNQYLWDEQFDNYPVVGLNPYQIKAFLDWKSLRHNEALRRTYSNIEVRYVLPTKFELEQFAGPENSAGQWVQINHKQQAEYWKITVDDYRQFMEWAMDSIARRMLADQIDASFMVQVHEESELPLLDWKYNWRYDRMGLEELGLFCNTGILCWPGDSAQKKIDSNTLFALKENKYFTRNAFNPRRLMVQQFYYNYSDAGYRDLDISYTNSLGQNNELRSHLNRRRFIYEDVGNIYPDTVVWAKAYGSFANIFWDSKAISDSPMKGLKYYQAIAFYRWRNKERNKAYRAKRIKEWNPIAADYLPTEEQWKAVMEGKNPVTESDTKVQLPGTKFRYVILVKYVHHINEELRNDIDLR